MAQDAECGACQDSLSGACVLSRPIQPATAMTCVAQSAVPNAYAVLFLAAAARADTARQSGWPRFRQNAAPAFCARQNRIDHWRPAAFTAA